MANRRHVVLLVREVHGIVQVVREEFVLERALDPIREVVTSFWRNVMGELFWREGFDAIREIRDVVNSVPTAHNECVIGRYVCQR